MTAYEEEIAAGKRFEFGSNWAAFLSVLDDERIALARNSLQRMLGDMNLDGRRFIDVGSGSGLFSLAARQLGASVYSFDYDPRSVSCTAELKRRYFAGDPEWIVAEGSALDSQYLDRLGKFDVVYSWGVLHHTGAMWQALENIERLVGQAGKLFISIYSDQGWPSRGWLYTKMAYNRLPGFLRWLVLYPAIVRLWGPATIRDIAAGRPFDTWRNYRARSLRGMSAWHDTVDWVGGLPFEVARPEEIFEFYRMRGYRLDALRTCAGRHGCNEFVFTHTGVPKTAASSQKTPAK